MSLSRRSEQKWEECGSRAPLQHSSQHTHAQGHTCVHMRTRTHTRPLPMPSDCQEQGWGHAGDATVDGTPLQQAVLTTTAPALVFA